VRPLRIIHIISALPVGGVERNLVRVLPRLDRSRFHLSVVCTREPGALAPEMEAAGIPVHLAPLTARYDPASLWRLRAHLRAAGADIVHCHMRRANTSGRLAALLAGVPVRIASERDMGVGKTWRHYLVDRWLARHTDVVMTVTRAVAEHQHRHSGIPRDKFRVIYNGLDLDRFRNLPPCAQARAALGIPADGPVIGLIGRLHAIKNPAAVLRALAEPALLHAHLALIGDGEERPALEALAARLGLRERVTFTGFRDDLETLYAAIDVSVMASASEGIANVQLESFAAGVPLVSTPVGIAIEAFRAGEQYLEVASPAPDLLACAIAEALDPERRRALSTAAAAGIQAFGIDTQVRTFESLYEELAARHGLDRSP